MRGLRLALMPVALLIALCGADDEAHAVDEACMKGLSNDVGRARKATGVYVGELKTVKNNPWSADAMSVCTSPFIAPSSTTSGRRTIRRSVTPDRITSTSQVVHLNKNAVITCRSSYEDVLKTTTPQEQRVMTQRVNGLLANRSSEARSSAHVIRSKSHRDEQDDGDDGDQQRHPHDRPQARPPVVPRRSTSARRLTRRRHHRGVSIGKGSSLNLTCQACLVLLNSDHQRASTRRRPGATSAT